MSDKRTKKRFGPLVLKAEIQIEGIVREGYLTNVGSGGAFLSLEDPPNIGTMVTLRAILPWSLGALRVTGRVVWRNDPGSNDDAGTGLAGAGITFTELDEKSQHALEAYLQRFAALAAELDESKATHDGH